MSPETRERLRRCLDESDGRMAVDRLLQIVEEAAEEARASERERCAAHCDETARRWGKKGDVTSIATARAFAAAAYSLASELRESAAPPSPEPERAPLFPNERFEAQSGNLPPLTYDWTPKPREPEAQTEAQRELLRKLRGDDVHALLPAVETRMREIVTEELNARPYMEYRHTIKPLAERIEALEGTVAGIPEARALALGVRIDHLEETVSASMRALERRVASLEGMAPATTPCTCPDGMIGHLPGCPVLLRMQERR